MILLKKLKLLNFLSHPDTELEFSPDDKLSIEGKSGGGKSSIVEGLSWALFGRGRMDSKNLVQKGKQGAKVVLSLTDGDAEWTVTRSVTAKGTQSLEILRDGSPVSAVSVKEKQEFLEREVMRCSYELFVNGPFFDQYRADAFLGKSSAEAKELLLSLVGARDIEEAGERARAELSAAEARLSSARTAAAMSEAALTAADARLDEAERNRGDAEKAKGDVSRLTLSLETAEREAKEAELAVEPVRTKAAELPYRQQEASRLRFLAEEKPDLTDWVKETFDLGIRVKQFRESKDLLAAESRNSLERAKLTGRLKPYDGYFEKMNRLEAELDAVLNEDLSAKKCDGCGKPYSFAVEDRDKRAEGVRARIAELQASEDLRTLENARTAAAMEALPKPAEDAVVAKWAEDASKEAEFASREARAKEKALTAMKAAKDRKQAESDLQEAAQKLMEASKAAEKYRELGPEAAALRERAAQLKDDLADARVALSAALSSEASWKQAGDDQTLAQGNADMAYLVREKAEKEAADMRLLRDAFGANGLMTLVVETVVPMVEDGVNAVLSELSDLSVRIDTQRDGTAKGAKVDGLFVTVRSASGDEMAYDNLSGGERVKVNAAFNEAFARFSRCGFRIYDELVVGLDRESTEAFTATLVRLMERTDQMVVISHLPEVQNLFEGKVEVTKDGGASKASRN